MTSNGCMMPTSEVSEIQSRLVEETKILPERTEPKINAMGPDNQETVTVNGVGESDIVKCSTEGNCTESKSDSAVLSNGTSGTAAVDSNDSDVKPVVSMNGSQMDLHNHVDKPENVIASNDGSISENAALSDGISGSVGEKNHISPSELGPQSDDSDDLILYGGGVNETGITVSPSEDKVLESDDDSMHVDTKPEEIVKSTNDYKNDDENNETDGPSQNESVPVETESKQSCEKSEEVCVVENEKVCAETKSDMECEDELESENLEETKDSNSLEKQSEAVGNECDDKCIPTGNEDCNPTEMEEIEMATNTKSHSNTIDTADDKRDASCSENKSVDSATCADQEDSEKMTEDYERSIGDEINAIVNGSNQNSALENTCEDVLEVEINAEQEYNIIEFDDSKNDSDSIDENVMKSPPRLNEEASEPKTMINNTEKDVKNDENMSVSFSTDSCSSLSSRKSPTHTASGGGLTINKSLRDSFKNVVQNAINRLSSVSNDDLSPVEKPAIENLTGSVLPDVRASSSSTRNLFDNLNLTSALVKADDNAETVKDNDDKTVNASDDARIVLLENSDDEEASKDSVVSKKVSDVVQTSESSQDVVRKREAPTETEEPDAKRLKVQTPEVEDGNSQAMSDFSSAKSDAAESRNAAETAMDFDAGTDVIPTTSAPTTGADNTDKPITEKDHDSIMQAKFNQFLTAQMEKIIAPLRKRVQELKLSNEAWKATAIELRKKVEEAEVMINQNEIQARTKRKVSTRSIGLQVDNSKVDKMRQAAIAASTVISQGRKISPAKSSPITGIPIRPSLIPSNTTLTTSSNPQLLQFVPSSATPPSVATFAKHQLIKPAGKALIPASPFPGQRVLNAVVTSTMGSQFTGTNAGTLVATRNNGRDLVIQNSTVVKQNTPRFTAAPIGQPQVPGTALTTVTPSRPTASLQVIDLTGDDAAKKKPAANVNIARSSAPQQLVAGYSSGQVMQGRPIPQLPAGTGILVNNSGQAVYVRQNPSSVSNTPTIIYQAQPGNTASTRPPVVTLLQQQPPTSNVRSTIVQVPVSSSLIQQNNFPQTAMIKSPTVTTRPPTVSTLLQAPPKQTAVHLPSSSSITVTPPPPKPATTVTAVKKPTPSHSAKHPAPLPSQPVSTLKTTKSVPPKPGLKISRVTQGIVLSWNMQITSNNEEISRYQLYAYQESSAPPNTSLWKRVGDVKALPLPMACTLTQFQEGNRYHFAVRAIDSKNRVGPFSDPSSIHLQPSSSSSTKSTSSSS